jgi:hypothetical protein
MEWLEFLLTSKLFSNFRRDFLILVFVAINLATLYLFYSNSGYFVSFVNLDLEQPTQTKTRARSLINETCETSGESMGDRGFFCLHMHVFDPSQ